MREQQRRERQHERPEPEHHRHRDAGARLDAIGEPADEQEEDHAREHDRPQADLPDRAQRHAGHRSRVARAGVAVGRHEMDRPQREVPGRRPEVERRALGGVVVAASAHEVARLLRVAVDVRYARPRTSASPRSARSARSRRTASAAPRRGRPRRAQLRRASARSKPKGPVRTPGRQCLALLPSGSDAVHRLPLRGARPGGQCSFAARGRPPRAPRPSLRPRAALPAGELVAARGARGGRPRAVRARDAWILARFVVPEAARERRGPRARASSSERQCERQRRRRPSSRA